MSSEPPRRNLKGEIFDNLKGAIPDDSNPLFAGASDDLAEHNRRIQEPATVLSEIMGAHDKPIPEDLLGKAQCVGTVPMERSVYDSGNDDNRATRFASRYSPSRRAAQ